MDLGRDLGAIFVVCCLLCLVCCLWFVVCCVVPCLLSTVCCSLFVLDILFDAFGEDVRRFVD